MLVIGLLLMTHTNTDPTKHNSQHSLNSGLRKRHDKKRHDGKHILEKSSRTEHTEIKQEMTHDKQKKELKKTAREQVS